jgi:hypothetical protein
MRKTSKFLNGVWKCGRIINKLGQDDRLETITTFLHLHKSEIEQGKAGVSERQGGHQ